MRWWEGRSYSFFGTFQLRHLHWPQHQEIINVLHRRVLKIILFWEEHLSNINKKEKMDQFSRFLTLCCPLAFVNWKSPRKLMFKAVTISTDSFTSLYYFCRNAFPFGWVPLGLGMFLRLLGLSMLYTSEKEDCLSHFSLT